MRVCTKYQGVGNFWGQYSKIVVVVTGWRGWDLLCLFSGAKKLKAHQKEKL